MDWGKCDEEKRKFGHEKKIVERNGKNGALHAHEESKIRFCRTRDRDSVSQHGVLFQFDSFALT